MMSNLNFQKFKHYKLLVEIDYFTYFTKCYLALNAYIKAKFDGSDREKIDKLKDDIISQNRFKEFFNKDIFIDNLKDFKQALYESQIKSEEIIISFERVKIQSFNPKILPQIDKDGIIYVLEILGGKDEKVKFKCSGKRNNDDKADEQCKYKDLEQILNQTKLSKTQRGIIKSTFDKEIKQYHQDLSVKIDKANNSSDEDKNTIYKGFIEIIYLLRNALFHSEIDPTQESIQKVYKLAYILFKDFLYKLPTEES